MAEVYSSGQSSTAFSLTCTTVLIGPLLILADPPIKRLAQRHIYLGTDAIADRDLGFAMARRAGSSNTIGRTETGLSVPTNSQATTPGNSLHHTSSGNKRPASPDGRKRDDGRSNDHGPGHKRARANSPPRAQERDRERWDGPPGRRRFNSPAPNPGGWDHRDDRGGGPGAGGGNGPRGREPLPPPRSQQSQHHDRDDDKSKSVQLPNVLQYFIGQLPAPASFDGTCCTLCGRRPINANYLGTL